MSRTDGADDAGEAGDKARGYTIDHHLSDAERNIHRVWDGSLDPTLTVEDGDVVRFECRDAGDRQLDTGSTAAT